MQPYKFNFLTCKCKSCGKHIKDQGSKEKKLSAHLKKKIPPFGPVMKVMHVSF